MNYTVVYNSTPTTASTLLTTSLYVLIALILLWAILRHFELFRRGPRRTKMLLLLALGLLCLSVSFRGAYYFLFWRHIYGYYGPYAVTEGVVKNYSWKKTSDSVSEQFEVNGILFGYLDTYYPKCFHTSAANDGPIHEGVPVRISYHDGCIVRPEVAKTALDLSLLASLESIKS